MDYEALLAFERDQHTHQQTHYLVQLSDGTTKLVEIKQLLDGVVPRETRMKEQEQQHRIEERTPDRQPQAPAVVAHPDGSAAPNWQIVAAAAIGVAFVCALLAIAIWFPEPTPFQLFVFRVVLALAAGGVGALIPGVIEVRFRALARAGGALALFLLVYMINPPALIAEATPPERPVSVAPAGGG